MLESGVKWSINIKAVLVTRPNALLFILTGDKLLLILQPRQIPGHSIHQCTYIRLCS